MKYILIVIETIFIIIQSVSLSKVSSGNKVFVKIIGNVKTELDTLLTLIKNITKGKCEVTVTKESHGSVYIRWGHYRCPGPHTSLIYSGYTAGADYAHSGGAAEYICLSKNPTKSTDRNKYTYGKGYIYGSEYEFGKSYNENEHDVPCAVCQSNFRPNAFMLPGRDICPTGWHLEYRGILMSGYYGHKAASQHVCVDNMRKTLPGGRENRNGKLFYPVYTVCGSLKCPPYKNDQLVTCAVCTR